jgi:hypothetical protein
MSNERTPTSKLGAEELQRLLAAAERTGTEVTVRTPRPRACTIDREDMVTRERAATRPGERRRRQRMMFPAFVVDSADEP